MEIMKETKNRVKKIVENILSFFKTPVPQVMERLSYIEDKLSEMDCRVNSNTKSFLHLQTGQAGFPGVPKDTSVNILTYILEDDKEIHSIISDLLRQHNFTNFHFFVDPETFLASLTADINICVIDHYLTGTTGLDMIQQVKDKNENSYVIVVSGQRNFDIAIEYLNQGADKYIDKNKVDYIERLIKCLQDGVSEASRRTAIIKFLEEKMKQ